MRPPLPVHAYEIGMQCDRSTHTVEVHGLRQRDQFPPLGEAHVRALQRDLTWPVLAEPGRRRLDADAQLVGEGEGQRLPGTL